jgi:predicted hotdog family 3-hydroxylacyl-ACP dehydratase
MLHDAICARLPHAGHMCLLERLESWDADAITCIATSHRDADNPLRRDDRLHAVAGVEYAAQAMALHGNLLSATDTKPAMGYLASVRDLKLELEDLGSVAEDLRITARRLSGDSSGFIYEFEIHAGARAILSGRLAAKLLAAGAVA